MKICVVATLLVAGVTMAVLIGCGKAGEPITSVSSTYDAVEKVVSTETATVSDVSFVNSYFNVNGDKEAVTRVYLKDERGLSSFVRHDFRGYHPEIVPGLKATSTYLHQTGGHLPPSGRYVTRLCVSVVDQEPVCKEGD